jgi:serine/threonine protein kinase
VATVFKSNKANEFLSIASLTSEIEINAESGGEFGPYEVFQEIGSGSFSQVYEARDTRDNRRVALKVFTTNFGGENFVREVGVGITLKHPNLINALNLGYATGGRRFVAYELARGGSLRAPIHLKTVTKNFIRHAVIEIARGLSALHAQSLVHRDVKPENILFERDGLFSRLRLTDWGTAERVRQENAKGESGSPAYMSPEQINGSCDTRADIYALGVIAYELITGKRPFLGSPVEVLRGHLQREPEWRGIDTKVAVVLAKALEKKPENRYQTVYNFARDLDNALAGDKNSEVKNISEINTSADGALAKDSISGWQLCRAGENVVLKGHNAPPFEVASDLHLQAQVCASSLAQIAIRDANKLVIVGSEGEKHIDNRIYGLPPLVALRRFAGDVVTVENVINPSLVIRNWNGTELKNSPLHNPLAAMLVIPAANGEHILGVEINRKTLNFISEDNLGFRPAQFQVEEEIRSLKIEQGQACIETVTGTKHLIEVDK